ncbi:cellulose synthase [Aureimonas glaciei]|uniref:Cellulose synthase n=1 Tax=Aureimonas glaciei TaxID=1776957 RepID=A0A916YGZ1_9HYPH|nr:cellulose synthase [Aureimonas glaciei]GGD44121.1 hypothetical protein GCM10011335_53400 [Aureimonas glaciei]
MTWRVGLALSIAGIEVLALVVGLVVFFGNGGGQTVVIGPWMAPALAAETAPGLGFPPEPVSSPAAASSLAAVTAPGMVPASDLAIRAFDRPKAVSVFSFADPLPAPTAVAPAAAMSDGALVAAPAASPDPAVAPAAETIAPAQPAAAAPIAPDPQPEPAPTEAPAATVDETALRYFARQGDTRRLETEIARLRALYPDWTPPADPMQVPDIGDAALDRMWQLYSAGKYAEVRAAIAERQRTEPSWQPPTDLLDRVGVAEARIRLVNGSNLQQYETVIRIATETPSLLTCSEVDVLWRLARAFVETKKPARALDAYLYILTNCENSGERLATIQMAVLQLDRPALDRLLALGRAGPDGVDEFASVRADLARRSVDAAGQDAAVTASEADLDIVRGLAENGGKASDLQLLGWYHLRRDAPAVAGDWFAKAHDAEDTPESAQGLALSLLAQSKPVEAETVMRPWSDESEASRKVYVAVAANLLAIEPPLVQTPPVLQAIVTAVVKLRDANASRQLGWYSYALNQFATAGQWFGLALEWQSDDEAAAFGLGLARQRLGDTRGLAQLQAAWDGLSPRIAAIGKAGSPGAAPGPAALPPSPVPPSTAQAAVSPPVTETAAPAMQPLAYAETAPAPRVARVAEVPVRPARTESRVRESSPRRSCHAKGNRQALSAADSLQLGWCLMDLDRPLEAVPAFERALTASSAQVRQDAAYGQSLAFLKVDLVDKAAVAATREPQPQSRRVELQTALLTAQAVNALDAKRPVETLMALEQRSRLAPDRVDLMILRGYAYFDLGRLSDAEKVFSAAAKAGSREGVRGVNLVKTANRSFVPVD